MLVIHNLARVGVAMYVDDKVRVRLDGSTQSLCALATQVIDA